MKANPPPGRRVPELDGLRGLAILLVVFFHYVFGGFTSEDGSLAAKVIHDIFPLAWSGVDLFFVLSGFLIGGSLMDYRDAENYFSTFYIRRVCRIFPVYFLWLALFIIVPWGLSIHSPSKWYSTLFATEIPGFPKWGYFVFLQNFYIAKTTLFGSSWLAATWSLAVEEQFYLLLPLVIWLVPPRRFFWVLISLILSVPACRIFLYLYHPSIFVYVLLPCRADTFLLGTLCAYCIRHEKFRRWLKKKRDWLYLTLAILSLGVGGLTVFAKGQDSFKLYSSFEMVSLGYSWLALLYAFLLLIVVTAKNGVLNSLMNLPFLRHFGTIAYGIFLTHMAMNNLMHGLILGKASVSVDKFSGGAATLLAFLATWLLAVLSWHFFEKPIVDWGHSFSYVHKKRRPVE